MMELHPSRSESAASLDERSQRKPGWPSWVFHACRLLLGGVFVFSSLPKLLLPDLFAQSLHDSGVATVVPAGVLLYAVPILKLTVGCLLLLGSPLLGAALVWSFVLLASFTLFQSYLLAWGVDAACGCFDPTSQAPAGWVSWVRTASLLVVSLIAGAAWSRSVPQPAPEPAIISRSKPIQGWRASIHHQPARVPPYSHSFSSASPLAGSSSSPPC